jgi:hypothetical protein
MRPAFMPRAKHRCELLRHIAGQRGLRRHASCRKAAARPNTLTLSVPRGYPAAPRTSQGLRPSLRCLPSEGRSPPNGGRGRTSSDAMTPQEPALLRELVPASRICFVERCPRAPAPHPSAHTG